MKENKLPKALLSFHFLCPFSQSPPLLNSQTDPNCLRSMEMHTNSCLPFKKIRDMDTLILWQIGVVIFSVLEAFCCLLFLLL